MEIEDHEICFTDELHVFMLDACSAGYVMNGFIEVTSESPIKENMHDYQITHNCGHKMIIIRRHTGMHIILEFEKFC